MFNNAIMSFLNIESNIKKQSLNIGGTSLKS